MDKKVEMKIRALERKDLLYIHKLHNTRNTMALWFREPYESVDELENLYTKHIHDDSERRFVIDINGEFAGIIELITIDYIHRNTEIQIIIRKDFQGKCLAQSAMKKGIDYAFNILNMYKVYLFVDSENSVAIHIYKKLGFQQEGILRKQFFANGKYHDSIFMGIFKNEITE